MSARVPAADALVWITGAGGLIGHELLRSAAEWAPGWRARGLTRADLDITNPTAVKTLFARERPDLLIHCAGVSKSPACEANRGLALATNVEATRYLAEAAANIPFIFFSTDLVFDGTRGGYTEDDPPNPLIFYGETKWRAEEVARRHPRHAIFRLSLTGGRSPTGERGFNEEMKNAAREGKTLNLFTDEYRCPMPSEIAARAVWDMAARGATGTFHLCGAEKLSRWDIGKLLAARHPEIEWRIQPGSRANYHGPPRPADTSMNIAKIQGALSFAIPKISDWLRIDQTGF
jgi:dTDP-4-dehydrorhamnose reductase